MAPTVLRLNSRLQFVQRYGFHGGVEDDAGVGDHDVDVAGGRDRRCDAGVVGDVQCQALTGV